MTSAASGAPSATIPAVGDHDDPRDPARREVEVVEDGDDRPAVASVQVGEQVHDVELVADVEMDRRLVEHDDRRGLGDRDGQQDELPLAERQLPNVAADEPAEPDPLDRRRNRRPVGRAEPAEPVLVRQPAERDDRLDRRRERQARRLRDDGDPARDLVAVDRRERPALTSIAPEDGARNPVISRSRVDLPAPFGPTIATHSPAPIARSTSRSTVRAP